MKTHSFAVAVSGVSSCIVAARAPRAGMAAQASSRSLRKRISAMLRLACRVVGLKRRKGLGLALMSGFCAVLGAAPAPAANGIHINAGAADACLSINDPQSRLLFSQPDFYMRDNLNVRDTAQQCSSVDGDQKDRVLFYRPSAVSGAGATSLMLGGELAVNGGFIKLGDESTGQRIGTFNTTAAATGLAVGDGAIAQRNGIAMGNLARASGSVAAMAIGSTLTVAGDYSTVMGTASNVSANHMTALGASISSHGANSVSAGRFAQAIGADTLALGRSTIARQRNSAALGLEATTSNAQSVALGAGSGTAESQSAQPVILNGLTYAFDSTGLQGVVSGGSPFRSRQFINVAPGMINAQSQDAVNGAQLFAAYDAINLLGASDRGQQTTLTDNAAGLNAARVDQAAMTGSMAQAIGGGASVGADGRLVMPAQPSAGQGPVQAVSVLDSLHAVDRDVKAEDDKLGGVFDRAIDADEKATFVQDSLQGFGPDETVAGRIDEVKRNSLAWDPAQGVYNAANASGGQHRISNLAAGQSASDAVNKGQLDQAVADVNAQGAGLLQERDGQLQLGRESEAAVVDLAGATPQRDAHGNAAPGGDGNALAVAQARMLTGLADGVNGNDAVNKAQLDGAAQTALHAQGAAAAGQRAADAAQGAAAGAQQSAAAAQEAAAGADAAANAALAAAGSVQSSLDASNVKLAGIGTGETVSGRIDAAAQAAVDSAGRAAGQALADALGGGSTVGADGKASVPAYGISRIGADGQVAVPGHMARNVGEALAALDGNVIKVNEGVLAQDAKAGQLTQDLAGLRGDSLLWDQDAGAFSAAHGADAPNRIVNLAAGEAATDAVNKGQLDAVGQTAASAQGAASEAERVAAGARNAASASLQAAVDAQATTTDAREAADTAQAVAMESQQAAEASARAGTTARQTAQAAQAGAADARQAAGTAQVTADGARQAADAAQEMATDAQQAATGAQASATGAQRTADAAQAAAGNARQSADAANAKLAGIGNGQTVAGRIAQAAQDAADAAGRAAGQSLANALGGGSSVGADGKASAPVYGVSQIGANGQVAAQEQLATNVGDAVAALDGNVIKVNERVLAQDAKVGQLTQDLAGLRGDSLLWDQAAGAFSAAHGADAPNRISNLAAGSAATDAVNKGQLDQAVADLKAQGAGLLQERDGQLQVGANSAATTVNLAGGKTQRDGQGNPVLDAEGNAVVAPMDRQLTGVADGVNGADLMNKRQLDGVAQSATAAHDAAATAQQAADGAHDTATGARQAATAAQGAAHAAQQTADAADIAAGGAQQAAGEANTRLAGIGDGETVIGRIEQAAGAAAEAANRSAAQSLSDALGGGSTVGADGKPSAPAYGISHIGTDGQAASQGQIANTAGGALAAIDANVIKVNDRVLAQDAKAGGLTQDLSGLRSDSLLWDQDAGAYSAARGADGANRIANVAAGLAGTDAVNKRQLDTVTHTAAAAQSDAMTAQLAVNAAQGAATQAQRTAQTAQGAASDAQRSADTANGKLAGIGDGETVAGRIDQAAQASGRSLTDVLGGGAAVRADGSVQGPVYAVTAVGADGHAQPQTAGTVSDAIKAIDGSVAAVNDSVNQVDTNVSTMRDQLTSGQMGLVRQDAASRDITVAAQTDGTRVTLQGAAGTRTLSGVKAGEVSAVSTETVVGSQLFTVNQDLLVNSQALSSLETLAGQQGVALGSLSALVDSGNVGLTRHDPGSSTVSLAADRGGDTVDVSGAGGGRQVTGLRDGRVQAGSADAVTGGQAHTVTERIDRLDAQGAGIAVDSRGDGSDRALVKAGSGGAAVGANAQAAGANSIATGAAARAQGAGSSAMGAGAQAQAAGSTAVGAGAKASAPGSVAVGEGAQATRANTVSVGSAGAERQVTHVAPATHGADAVNLRQAMNLSRQDANQARRQASRHTDSRVSQLRRENNAGIASAMAMAALPSTATPGKSMFALSAATYDSQSAVAMGMSARSGSGAWVYRVSLSGTTGGQTGASVGLSYAW